MPTLEPGMLFTVVEYPYTTFEFGTDRGYNARYGLATDAPGTPWAFPHAATISDRPQPKPAIAFALQFGSLVEVPNYGTYRLERDYNRNVQFVPVPTETEMLTEFKDLSWGDLESE